MILITSAKYINPELEAEFGKIPPSFLPLGGNRLFEHQYKLLKTNNEEKIYMSLPQSFSISNYDMEKILKLGIELIFVPDGLSLGKSLSYVFNILLPINEGISILHGDTLFNKIENTKINNSIMISQEFSNYDWTYISVDKKPILNIKSINIKDLDKYIISGYFNIDNPYGFMKALTIRNYSFNEALKLYSEENPFELIINEGWLDFGLSTNYFHFRKNFTTERAFNSLIIKDGYVIKSSVKKNKLKSEINWFKNFPNELDLYIPRFNYMDEYNYKTEYLYLSALNELYVLGKLPKYVWKTIFESISLFLNKLHAIKDKNIIDFNYKKKTLSRINEFAITEKLDIRTEWLINGVKAPSIFDIIEDLDNFMTPNEKDENSFIHGDICFSNIMYDFKSNQVKVFDPRGIDFSEKITVFGKSEYDYAKLMHSCIGLYDFIISGYYKLDIIQNYELNFELEISQEIIEIQEIFNKTFGTTDKLYAIMIHLFLSMLPLHSDNKNRQYALLANAFRLYKELKKD